MVLIGQMQLGDITLKQCVLSCVLWLLVITALWRLQRDKILDKEIHHTDCIERNCVARTESVRICMSVRMAACVCVFVWQQCVWPASPHRNWNSLSNSKPINCNQQENTQSASLLLSWKNMNGSADSLLGCGNHECEINRAGVIVVWNHWVINNTRQLCFHRCWEPPSTLGQHTLILRALDRYIVSHSLNNTPAAAHHTARCLVRWTGSVKFLTTLWSRTKKNNTNDNSFCSRYKIIPCLFDRRIYPRPSPFVDSHSLDSFAWLPLLLVQPLEVIAWQKKCQYVLL